MSNQTPTVAIPVLAAVLTPRGRGAVTTVAVRGGDRVAIDRLQLPFRAANGKPMADQSAGRVCFGHWGGDVFEEVVVCRTDDCTLEIHCHGGEFAGRRILDDVRDCGCRVVTWQEYVAANNGVLATECLSALANAATMRTAEILLQQHSGALRSALAELLELTQNISDRPLHVAGQSAVSLANVSPAAASQSVMSKADTRQLLQARLSQLLQWSDFGLHLVKPWQVVLAGRPNVGKSSLINALVGYSRAIVCDQPGTTRDVVTAEAAFSGWPLQLSDTAGIRDAAERLESAGIERAREQLASADCRLLLIDTSSPPDQGDFELLEAWPEAVVVAHKADLADVWQAQVPKQAIRVSSKTGAGLSDLTTALVKTLVPEVPLYNQPLPISQRLVDLLYAAQHALERNDAEAVEAALLACLA